MGYKEKGITLVALIITIIVLLILSGVTIAMILGQNGIIYKANMAKEEERAVTVEEQKNLWKINRLADIKTGTVTSGTLQELLDNLKEQNLLTQEDVDTIIGNEEKGIEATGQVTINGKTIVFGTGGFSLAEMFKQAEKDGCENLDGTCKNKNHLHVGDEISYNPGTEGEYTSLGSNTGMTEYKNEDTAISEEEENQKFKVNSSVKWQVLGTEGEGINMHIKLISANPIKPEVKEGDGFYHLYGARGYINAEEELNNICSIYGNGKGSKEARCVTAEDINNACGVTIDSAGLKPKGVDVIKTYGTTKTYEFSTQDAQYASPEDFLNGKKSEVITKTSNAYGYSGNTKGLKTEKNTRLYNMLFSDTVKNCYWLASRSINTKPEYAFYCVGLVYDKRVYMQDGLFFGNGSQDYDGYGIRPVVILDSETTLESL